ncbi:murein L,D-transpeptidase family protein [Pseudomonas fluorescens]|uniref:L,D-transpeptidase family protein n=1 Tax=Pseudomonas fluorescens TaxID=294 RepID=UPI000F46C4AD|nr:L,D-transpeptidase [Pseudomonas fluorescens]
MVVYAKHKPNQIECMKKMKAIICVMTLIPVALSLAGCPKKAEITSESAGPCSGRKTIVLVKLEQERLFLCKNGLTVKEYNVAIGKGGYGKTKDKDNKTPIGTYPLLKPRDSGEGFHTFIPVDYPTPKQMADGYTGGAIGIHGPHEKFAWAGVATTWFNWTKGCVAVKSNKDIDDIKNWVNTEKVNTVTLEL